MAKVMTAADFVERLKSVAKNYKTLYVMGCFGAPMNDKNKARYKNNNDYNRQASRQKLIQNATADTFGFDCVCLIKGILWGWCGDKNAVYGGAKYESNGVPDISADTMITKCSGVSTNFSGIEPGEAVWKKGHIGVYIGDGLAVECTPAWENDVQITAVANIGKKTGYNARTWTKHGKLPWIDYAAAPVPEPEPEQPGGVIDIQAMIVEALENSQGPYIYTIGDIPHSSVAKEMRKLLDCGAINGGTSFEVDPDDINLPYSVVRALVAMKRYVELLFKGGG